ENCCKTAKSRLGVRGSPVRIRPSATKFFFNSSLPQICAMRVARHGVCWQTHSFAICLWATAWACQQTHSISEGRRARWRLTVAQPSIVILDDDRGQPIGAQIRAILAAQGSYRIDLTGRQFIHAQATSEPPPELIVPILSESKEQGQRLLSELRALV